MFQVRRSPDGSRLAATRASCLGAAGPCRFAATYTRRNDGMGSEIDQVIEAIAELYALVGLRCPG
jgi:hypothetical protein